MICILALIVFSILAIFSASHRPLAKEAFECVFLRVTFRKCKTGLDTRVKSSIIGRIMKKSPSVARFVYKHFEIFSWTLVILLVISLGYSVYGGYNYYLYGNCYGPEENSGFCIYNALGGEEFTELHSKTSGEIKTPDADNDPYLGSANAKVEIIEFGCYSCPYSRQAQPIVNQLIEKYGDTIKFVFRDFPIDNIHSRASLHAEAAGCALEQDKFWEYHKDLFTEQDVCSSSGGDENHLEHIVRIATENGLDMKQFAACLKERKYKEEVKNDFKDGIKAGVHGTPTFFINGRTIIGPKPLRAFEKIIDEELAK
ncbi:thioredoxin domain-containing protein [Candidatus Woesearchaeota archaeon]|nr:thioredoxin domain-containing protein [Candidatus Woesearchaeota archaeon]